MRFLAYQERRFLFLNRSFRILCSTTFIFLMSSRNIYFNIEYDFPKLLTKSPLVLTSCCCWYIYLGILGHRVGAGIWFFLCSFTRLLYLVCYFTSLSLNFLICEMRIIYSPNSIAIWIT